jgi:hypothetical protein
VCSGVCGCVTRYLGHQFSEVLNGRCARLICKGVTRPFLFMMCSEALVCLCVLIASVFVSASIFNCVLVAHAYLHESTCLGCLCLWLSYAAMNLHFTVSHICL